MLHPWYQLDDAGEIRRFSLYIPAILRKNERYRAFGRGRFARIILSAPARKFETLVTALVAQVGAPQITYGTWRLIVHTVWDKQRHVTPSVPGGDSDASLSAVKDALQSAGVIDDDVRILCDVTHNYYEKGQRGVYVVLERLDGVTGGELPLEVRNARIAGAELEERAKAAKPKRARAVRTAASKPAKRPAKPKKPAKSKRVRKVRGES